MAYRLEHTQLLQAEMSTLIDFFSDVSNLDSNTPSFFRLQLLEGRPGGALEEGQIFSYRFSLFGISFPWVTRIDQVGETYFVDSQQRGVYKSFRHLHAFYPSEHGTLMVDRVDYELPFLFLNPVINTLAVRPMLEAIFRFRARQAGERFGEVRV